MKRYGALTLAIVSLAVGLRAAQPVAAPDTRLVLLIAVDQFRYDYLTRFRADYTRGIKRLLTSGAVFTDANLEHYPTVTAVGHSTMLSGATPSVSGIIGNDWFDRATGATVASVFDPRVTPVGSDRGPQASPRRLLVTTVGDELKIAGGLPKGEAAAPRVFGVSLKDRGAVFTGGAAADAAYWWDAASGRFVTSTYYLQELPAWVLAFNDRKLPDAYAGTAWTATGAPSVLLRQLPVERGATLYDAVYESPSGNELLGAFARELLTRERLGQRNVTDLLSISFSSNDSVGHTYGPDSPQVRDMSLRTDDVIGRLLDQVSTTVGLEHTLVVFTADHGVASIPESLQARGLPGGRITPKALFDPIQERLAERFGAGKWILGTAGSSPYLDHDMMAARTLDPEEVRGVAAAAAARVPQVARVYTRDALLRGDVPDDRIGSRVLRGFNAHRSGDLEIILEPNWLRQAEGTTHGTPYGYDAHIPLILMGRQIAPGEYADHVALNDLAPTLATLLGVAIPNGSSGRILREALRRPGVASKPNRQSGR